MGKKKKNKLTKDVTDLLNQIVVILKDVKHQEEYVYDDDTEDELVNPDYDKEDHYLCMVKLVCQELASGNEYSDVFEYFNSYCYWNET